MKHQPYKIVILIGIMAMMFLPMLQHFFHFIREPKLEGDFHPSPEPKFSFADWWNHKFQQSTGAYLNDHVGFHHSFIRLRNQVAFSIFRQARANGVIIGKNTVLFEETYIQTLYGQDYVSHDVIRSRMHKLKLVSEDLQKKGKSVIVLFAPGKGAFFEEYIPERMRQPKGPTNLRDYVEYAGLYEIPHINFHQWFLDQKANSPFPLFPKLGTHWSTYGAALVSDSLLHYMEELRNIDMPEYIIQNVEWQKAHDDDIDIARGMNLFKLPKRDMLGYPAVIWEPQEGKDMPAVMIVGDSFYWSLYGKGISYAFSKTAFWYYNYIIYKPEDNGDHVKVEEVDFINEIKPYEVIILISTDSNLKNFGWGFIENYCDKVLGISTDQE